MEKKAAKVTPSDIKNCRAEMLKRCERLSASNRLSLLNEYLQASRGQVKNHKVLLEGALARILIVRYGDYESSSQARRWLMEAVKTFESFAKANRDVGSYGRDARLILGNFLVSESAYDEAALHYLKALQHEKDPDRRGRAAMNLARAYLWSGDVVGAFNAVEKIPLADIHDEDLRRYVLLLTSRCLIIVGREREAANILAKISLPGETPAALHLETLFLTMLTTLDPSEAKKNLLAYENFIKHAAPYVTPEQLAFYQCEAALLRTFTALRSIRHGKKFSEELTRLAKLARNKTFKSLSVHAKKYIAQEGKSLDLEPFWVACKQLLQESHHHLFLLLGMDALAKAIAGKRPQWARRFVKELDIYFFSLEQGLPTGPHGQQPPPLNRWRSHFENLKQRTLSRDLSNNFKYL